MKPNQIRVIAALLANLAAASSAQQLLPNTGQRISPLAPSGATFEALNPGLADNPKYRAGQAVTAVASPDGKTLLVLTSGYNMLRSGSGAPIQEDSTQFIFAYDISRGRPVQKQVIQLPNTYSGITFDPTGGYFYASG